LQFDIILEKIEFEKVELAQNSNAETFSSGFSKIISQTFLELGAPHCSSGQTSFRLAFL
jgi:hypothetical protein